jgi:hypothetical protein
MVCVCLLSPVIFSRGSFSLVDACVSSAAVVLEDSFARDGPGGKPVMCDSRDAAMGVMVFSPEIGKGLGLILPESGLSLQGKNV